MSDQVLTKRSGSIDQARGISNMQISVVLQIIAAQPTIPENAGMVEGVRDWLELAANRLQ